MVLQLFYFRCFFPSLLSLGLAQVICALLSASLEARLVRTDLEPGHHCLTLNLGTFLP